MLFRKEKKERINAHQLKKDYKRANRRGRKKESERKKVGERDEQRDAPQS